MLNLYDMNQLRNNVTDKSLSISNVQYGSSTLSKEQGLLSPFGCSKKSNVFHIFVNECV